MDYSKRELPIPEVARKANKSMEMARIWLADGDQVVVLTPNLWSDPATWGLMLVDLARHIAVAYEAKGKDQAEVLERIHEAMLIEWEHPTDK